MIKRIYCIVVTYNGIQWIQKCLNSLLQSTLPVNIVVIDSGSGDQTPSFIQSNFPSVQLIVTEKNLGFGQANNIGFEIALKNEADYIFLLNQDAWVEPDCISLLVQAHIPKPQYGIVSPLHMNGEGSSLDRYFLDYFLESSSKEFISSLLLSKSQSNTLIETEFVNAAAWLLSIECVRKTGGFDPIFFHYGEDANYVHRAMFWGFKIGIHTGARMYHDREKRISKAVTENRALLQKEWIHFLNQACNIQQPHYKLLIIRRFIRYFLQMCGNVVLFRKNRFAYNLFMTKKIAISYHKIKASRKRSLVNCSMPYLN